MMSPAHAQKKIVIFDPLKLPNYGLFVTNFHVRLHSQFVHIFTDASVFIISLHLLTLQAPLISLSFD